MKKLLWTALLSGAINLTALGGVYTFDSSNPDFKNGGVVPDGSLAGLANTLNVSGLTSPIASVTVSLNISGGYNGDMYAYLSFGGVLVPLLNHVGTSETDPFGYANSGFSATLTDSAATSIHDYQTVSYTLSGDAITGNWKPDGGT